ncbi:hypothetical protein ACFY9N_11575 [Microbacterium sp. NPDC008134]|uniref:hypothetical protein n=1 Tax=Microbacterium sp. NPDC008134 TaxID=3364183 RepID=UPI0036ED6392
MGSEFFRQPTKRLDREFRALGGRRLDRSPGGTRYIFPDGGVQYVPADVMPGRARAILVSVQERYATRDIRPKDDPLRSAMKRDGAPDINADTIAMSRHANDRFELMATQARLDRREIGDALRFPEQVLWSPTHESWMWVRGRVIVAVAETDQGINVIRTIMWATSDLWEQNPRPERSGGV